MAAGLFGSSFDSYATVSTHTASLSVEVIGGPAPSPTPTPTPTPPSGGGGVGVPVLNPSVVNLSGFAYPFARVDILRDGQLIGITEADAFGFFSFTDSGLAGGNYGYGMIATDSDGKKSDIVIFFINVVSESTTALSGIVISPTISINKENLLPTDTLIVSGQSTPGATVNIEISPDGFGSDSFYEVVAKGNGRYVLEVSLLRNIRPGIYSVKAKTELLSGEESIFSQKIAFGVGVPLEIRPKLPFRAVDFNGDERVNIVDLSILAFWYKRSVPLGHFSDLKPDGVIDVADFSVLVFFWTG